ncbi:MAG: MotA/TolQ/ExbB proton channel family protein [Candidatus Riflemargulisbacteria bacterium]
MDKATIIGFFFGVACMVYGIEIKNLPFFLDPIGISLTIGGATASVMISFTMEQFFDSFKMVGICIKPTTEDPVEILEQILVLSEKSRREGILALDKELKNVKFPFLVKGLQLVVDGNDAETVKEVLNLEKDAMNERHNTGKHIWEALSEYYPAWGMIGTVVGLIQMLGQVSDPEALGPAMAVALLTTFFGAFGAFFICVPIAYKLKMRAAQELGTKELIIVGILAIQSGDNPRTIKEKLSGCLSPLERQQLSKKEKGI